MKEMVTESLVMPTVLSGRGSVVPVPVLPCAAGLSLVGLVHPTANTNARTITHPTRRRTRRPPCWHREGHLATRHNVYAIYEAATRREGTHVEPIKIGWLGS